MFDILRDSFTRANEGPPPSSSWTNLASGSLVGLRVVSNQLKKATTGPFTVGGAYWNAETFGPDCEVALKFVADAETNDFVSLGARVVNIGVGTLDGYEVEVRRTAGGHDWSIARWDDDVISYLGATFSQTVVSGDFIGIRLVGSLIQAWYRASAGSWTMLAERTDSTYTAAGSASIRLGDVTDQNVTADDFYAQTSAVTVARAMIRHSRATSW